MARSTEDFVRDAFEFHAEHGERVAAADPVPVVRTGNRWIPAAAFGAVAAIATVVATVVLATSGAQDPGPATVPDPASVSSVSSATGEPAAVAIPDLVGLTPDQANARLTAVGLTMVSQQTQSEESSKNRAVAQNPTADTLVHPGSTVTVTFGTGVALETIASTSDTAQFVMPDVTDLTPREAAAALESVGWTGDVTTLTTLATSRETTDPAQVGKVLSQTPDAGATVATTVRVRVEIGVG